MSEHTVDNTISYTRNSGWKVLAFLCVFLIAGIATIIKFDSYFTDFWKIRKCSPEGYASQDFMTSCAGIKIDRYSFGSIYLGSQKNAVKNAEDADVIVFGNSRTMRSFSTDAIDNYFRSKGLTYMVLASEGASFRSAVLTADKMKLSPKIVMVNNEIFISDKVSAGFRELVDFPDKYKTRFDFFNMAQTVQRSACASNVDWLKKFYCLGKSKGNWRSASTGRLKWDLIAADEKQELVIPRKDIGARVVPKFIPNAKELIGHSDFQKSCPILYIVNSPVSSADMLEGIGNAFDVQTIYTELDKLYTYDKSHLDRPNSEKWAQEFVKELDPLIEVCLSGNGKPNFDKAEAYMRNYEVQQAEIAARRENATKALEDRLAAREERDEKAAEIRAERAKKREQTRLDALRPKGVPYIAETADVTGLSNFEQWDRSGEIEVLDKASLAPNQKAQVDRIIIKKSPARIRYIYRDQPIKAGTTLTFGGWFWSNNPDASIRLQIVRSCSSTTPLETASLNSNLTKNPYRLEVSHTFKYDHECALVQILGLGDGVEINAWQGRADFSPLGRQEN